MHWQWEQVCTDRAQCEWKVNRVGPQGPHMSLEESELYAKGREKSTKDLQPDL